MKKKLLILFCIMSGLTSAFAQNTSTSQDGKHSPQQAVENNMVRLAKITIDPTRLDSYNAYLKEEIEASLRLEPGVLTLYAVSEKAHPNKITILEIYADEAAYKSHIKTSHFLKYKEGTLDMVQELELVEADPLIPGMKIK